MNYMNDLRREVVKRLRQTLDGKEVDMMKEDVLIEHMLGVTEIGEEVTESDINGTILHRDTQFWKMWHEEIHTEYDIRRKISSTIKSLLEDETLNISYPYGKDAEVAFIEVNWPQDNNICIQTTCNNCSGDVEALMSLSPSGNSYSIVAKVICDNCGESGLYESNMILQ